MSSLLRVAGLLGVTALCLGAGERPRGIEQVLVETPGFVEPHTPGWGAPEAFEVTPTVAALVGPTPDLNRVSTVRTRRLPPGRARGPRRGPRPRIVLILIPGFLGGAGTFDPIARDLVHEFDGALEVWAVDRRSSQLEDRRGALAARAGVEAALEAGDDQGVREAVADGVRFYYDVDLDGDGEPEPRTELPDALGGLSSFQRLAQDDLRFGALWGVDTYVRDWRLLVEEARALVGRNGLVLFGGHSMGTTWTGVFAAYDFDPGPAVLAGYELVDGLLLLEGGGPCPPGPGGCTEEAPPDSLTYQLSIVSLARPGGPPIFLEDLFGFIDAVDLGNAGELTGLAGSFLPDEPAILQKTPLFGGFPVSILLGAPMTNRSLVGFFLDDDFSTNSAFSVSMGFSDNAPNQEISLGGPSFYVAEPGNDTRRTWKSFDDPSLPICPPNDPHPRPGEGQVGCAIVDHGPKPPPGQTGVWGLEREVTDPAVLIRSLYETANASEWYFVSGRPFLDFSYGRDSSALGLPELLNVTRNAHVDVPILGIGGSNGLATTEASFASYLDSVATSPEDQTLVILEGYSHVDVISASDNEAVPPIVEWIENLAERKRGRPKGVPHPMTGPPGRGATRPGRPW